MQTRLAILEDATPASAAFPYLLHAQFPARPSNSSMEVEVEGVVVQDERLVILEGNEVDDDHYADSSASEDEVSPDGRTMNMYHPK